MPTMSTFTTPDGVTYEITDKKAREALEKINQGVAFETDETLSLDPETGVLSVNTANKAEQNNTLPITSAAVYAILGNIESQLNQI